MEILGIEPKTTICKIAVLPTKLYPLYFTGYPPEEDSQAPPYASGKYWFGREV